MRFVADHDVEHLRPTVETVEHLVREAAVAARAVTRCEHAVVAHGSSTLTRLVRVPGDIDLAAWLRFRPTESYGTVEDADRAMVPAMAHFLAAMMQGIRDVDGVSFLRLRTVWNASHADPDRVNANYTLLWSAEDLAVGTALTPTGEVSLREALENSATAHIALVIERDGRLETVDLSIDRSIVAPGGIVNLNTNAAALWFAKVCFSQRMAERAVAMERELARAFSDRYDPVETWLQTPRHVFRRWIPKGEGMKVAKFLALAAALREDEEAVREIATALEGAIVDRGSLAGRLAAIVQTARRRELDDEARRGWAMGTIEELASLRSDERDEADAQIRSLAVHTAGALRGGDTSPPVWAATNQLARLAKRAADRLVMSRLNSNPGLSERLLDPALAPA